VVEVGEVEEGWLPAAASEAYVEPGVGAAVS
jgi:hypothetical protein